MNLNQTAKALIRYEAPSCDISSICPTVNFLQTSVGGSSIADWENDGESLDF